MCMRSDTIAMCKIKSYNKREKMTFKYLEKRPAEEFVTLLEK